MLTRELLSVVVSSTQLSIECKTSDQAPAGCRAASVVFCHATTVGLGLG